MTRMICCATSAHSLAVSSSLHLRPGLFHRALPCATMTPVFGIGRALLSALRCPTSLLCPANVATPNATTQGVRSHRRSGEASPGALRDDSGSAAPEDAPEKVHDN